MLMFDGVTYDPTRDGERLTSQLERVKQLMLDGQWRTLDQVAAVCGGTTASVSARLRDLRKPKFGPFIVQRTYIGDGLWQYRVCPDWLDFQPLTETTTR